MDFMSIRTVFLGLWGTLGGERNVMMKMASII